MGNWLLDLVAGVLGRWTQDFDDYVWSDPLASPPG